MVHLNELDVASAESDSRDADAYAEVVVHPTDQIVQMRIYSRIVVQVAIDDTWAVVSFVTDQSVLRHHEGVGKDPFVRNPALVDKLLRSRKLASDDFQGSYKVRQLLSWKIPDCGARTLAAKGASIQATHLRLEMTDARQGFPG